MPYIGVEQLDSKGVDISTEAIPKQFCQFLTFIIKEDKEERDREEERERGREREGERERGREGERERERGREGERERGRERE